ncbi:MAG: lipid-A-disaccharide synthase [Deltaproteobacteria bacterium]|nr:MAG: lipid-A-disaccharide synthase [Deltaproteobacteria bacterium]
MSRVCAERQNETLVAIVAGEASADLHGANLVKAIRELNPNVSFMGLGGPNMEAEGVKSVVSADKTAVVGLSEVFRKIGNIAKAYFGLRRILRKLNPCLVILLDYPEFNLKLASEAKKCGIPVMYYISPQVWAWRAGRVRKIASVVDRMVCILPFEKEFYEKQGISVDYVGHPLCDIVPEEIDQGKLIVDLGLENNYPIVGLLPGSRDHEVESLLPHMLGAIELLHDRYPSLGCVLPLAPTIKEDRIRELVKSSRVTVRISRENIYALLSCCYCAMIASGTVTLQAAIAGLPMVIAYKVSPLTFFLGKRLVKVRHICLVNLVAGYEVVPELIQSDVTPHNLARHLINIIENEKIRAEMKKGLEEVRRKLGGGGASRRAAEIALQMIKSPVPDTKKNCPESP